MNITFGNQKSQKKLQTLISTTYNIFRFPPQINNNYWFENHECVRYFIKGCMYFTEIVPLFFPSILYVVERQDSDSCIILISSFFSAIILRVSVHLNKNLDQCFLNPYIHFFTYIFIYLDMLCLVPFVLLASVLATIDTEQQGRGVIILVPIFAMYVRSTFSGINDKYAKFLSEIIKRIQPNSSSGNLLLIS